MSAAAMADNAGNSTPAARNIGTLTATPQVFSDWIAPVDTDDYYKFTLSTLSTLDLKLFGLTAQANLRLLDSAGNQLFTTTGNQKNYGELNQTLAAGTYYADVQYFGGENSGNYQFSASATAVPDIAGNSLATAHVIGTLPTTITSGGLGLDPGGPVTMFTDWVGAADPNDYYKFTLATEATVHILQFEGEMLPFGDAIQGDGVDQPTSAITLLRSDGSTVQTQFGSTSSDASPVYDLAAGDYYIDVSVHSNDTPYKLWVNAQNYIPVGAYNIGDHGNDMATAYPEGDLDGIGTGANGYLYAASPDQYYRFELSRAATSIDVLLEGVSSAMDLDLEDSAGNIISSSSATLNQDGSLVHDLAAGTYYIHLKTLGDDNAYYFSIDCMPLDDTAGTSTATATNVNLQNTADDFNGNGVSDILFRNDATGDTGFYQMKAGGTLQAWDSVGASSTDYTVAATSDLNSDGVTDILFRNNAGGDTGFYQMSSAGAVLGWHDIGVSSTNYSVLGIGDFFGNGSDDVLFRSGITGDIGFYALNSDGMLQGWHDIGVSSTAYAGVGIGNFTGGGGDDILFRNNATGDTGFYEMNGDGSLQGWHDIGASSTAYSVVGVGDFSGDGNADVLFRNNATGDTGFYQINSDGTLQGWHDVGASSTAYSVVGTGDYSGDGTSDILYRNNITGDTGFYAIVGGANQSWHDVGASSTAYHVAG